MAMSDEELQAFSKAYTSATKRSVIAVDDRNREFRASVARFVAKTPSVAPTELIEDLVAEESTWSRYEIGFGAFAILVSELLIRGGTHRALLLWRLVGRHMDVDGTLMNGGLRLTPARREELLEEVRQLAGKADPRVAIIETALLRAAVRPEKSGLDV